MAWCGAACGGQGLHSLRLTTPSTAGGVVVNAYPVGIEPATNYTFEVAVRGAPCAANGTMPTPTAVLQLVFGAQWARVWQAPAPAGEGSTRHTHVGVGGTANAALGGTTAVNISVPCGSGWVAQRFRLRSAAAVARANWLTCALASPATVVWIDDLALAKA